MVDCILSYAATVLVEAMADPANEDGQDMLARVRSDARGSKQARALPLQGVLLKAWAMLLTLCDGRGHIRYVRTLYGRKVWTSSLRPYMRTAGPCWRACVATLAVLSRRGPGARGLGCNKSVL